MNQQCIICGGKKFSTVLAIKNAPAYVERLLSKDALLHDKKISLKLIKCEQCKLCQLMKSNFVESDFYDNYQMAVSYSQQMQEYQKWSAGDFVNHFDLKGKRAFEIGCGDGMFASLLNKQGLQTTGVEPSKPFYILAKSKIKVINQYLDKNTLLRKKYYDAFVARQVFEHLKNPNQILEAAKLFLKPDGVGLIEVPSFLTALKDNRYYDIFRDHVVYYTKYTLQYLLCLHNFEVIKIFHSANNEYLIAYFKNNDYHDQKIKLFSAGFTDYKKKVKNLLRDNRNKRVAVWGAGGKGIAILSMCDVTERDILFIIDSDEHKKGKYTSGSHILIKSPQEVDFKIIDLIVISAVMYQKEIIKNLKEKYKYKNKIAIISPNPTII